MNFYSTNAVDICQTVTINTDELTVSLSVHHNLRMWLLMHRLLLPSVRPLSRLTIPHLHIIVSLLFFSFFILAAAAFSFEIFTASIRVIISFFLGAGSFFGSAHLLIFACCSRFGFFGCKLGLEAFLELKLFCTVVDAVIFDSVGLRLLGREFGWR